MSTPLDEPQPHDSHSTDSHYELHQEQNAHAEKVPILANEIDQSVTPEEDETQKNYIQLGLPSQWKCPWCALTVFDSVETGNELLARRCYKCGALGIIGKIHETDPIIDTAMRLHAISETKIYKQRNQLTQTKQLNQPNKHSDRVHCLQQHGLSMRSGYLEMESEDGGEASQGLWFRRQDTADDDAEHAPHSDC